MRPHVRGVVLEGLGNAGKTSTLRALKLAQAKHENAERSVLVLGEHYSQQLHNINGELISLARVDHIKLLNDRLDALEKMNDWAADLGPASRRSRGLFFILERFHLNHQISHGSSLEASRIESRISDLGGVCFVLTVSALAIQERIRYRDKSNLNAQQFKQICDQWLKDQERLIELSQESDVQTVLINTDNQDWDAYATQIISTMNN